MVNTADLKSAGGQPPCGFESRHRHFKSALDESHPYTRRITVTETGRAGQAGRSVRVVGKALPLAILQEMARLLGLGQKPAAKPGRAKGQPGAGAGTVAELMTSLGVARVGVESPTDVTRSR